MSIAQRMRMRPARRALTAAVAGAMVVAVSPVVALADHTLPSNVCPPPGESLNEPFTDVDNDGEFRDTIACVFGYGIADGTSATTYDPSGDVTRGEMAKFISNLIETAAPGTLDLDAANTFSDVVDGGEFEDFISALADAGVIDGFGDGTYRPGDPVLRGEMAKFIHNAIEAVTGDSLVDSQNSDDDTNGNDDNNAFDDDDGSIFEDVIDALAAESIVEGPGGDVYVPEGIVTRGEMSAFIMRSAAYLDSVGAFEPTADEGGPTPTPSPSPSASPSPTPSPSPSASPSPTPSPTPTPEPLAVSFTDDNASANGGIVTGELTDETGTIASATVSGCGLTDEEVEDGNAVADGIQFVEQIPSGNAPGTCTLTFTVTYADASTDSITGDVTITQGTPPQEGGNNPALANNVTDVPELIGAEVTQTNPDNIVVTYTFDENVEAPAGPSSAPSFALYPFVTSAPSFVTGTTVIFFGNTAVVTFDGVRGNEADYYSVATVQGDEFGSPAVVDSDDGNANPIGDAPLDPATPAGLTDAPDLVDVENFDAAADTVAFVFDEPIDMITGANNDFFLIDDDNTRKPGMSITPDPANDNILIIGFADIQTTEEQETARAVVRPAVEDADHNDNPRQAVDVSGGDTDAPDLVDVEIDLENNQAFYDFDVDVQLVGGPNQFRIYSFTQGPDPFGPPPSFDDEEEANTVFRSSTDRSVIVATFDEDELESAVGGSVGKGVVQTLQGTVPDQNEADAEPVTNRDPVGGITTAPDLIDAFVQNGSVAGVGPIRVVFDFDENSEGVFAGAFYLYDGDGNRTQADDCIESVQDANQVICTFGATDVANATTIESGVLASVGAGAVFDGDTGLNSPEGTTLLDDPDGLT